MTPNEFKKLVSELMESCAEPAIHANRPKNRQAVLNAYNALAEENERLVREATMTAALPSPGEGR